MPSLAVLTNEGDPTLARSRAALRSVFYRKINRDAYLHIIGVEFNPR